MAEIIKETVTTQEVASDPSVDIADTPTASIHQTTEYLIYFIFAALEILLVFRMVLKITGANTLSDFVSFIYNLSSIFVMPFEGIFRTTVAKGMETAAVFEPATLVAMLVYAVVVWGIVKLIRVITGKLEAE